MRKVSRSFSISTLNDGTSPWLADLDNEMDSVACDKNGNPTSTQTVSTNVFLYYGSEKENFTVSAYKDSAHTQAYTNSSTLSNGIAVWWTSGNSQSNTINVKVSSALTISNSLTIYIVLTAQEDNSITRTLNFTVNGIREGESGQPATIYGLVPNYNEIVKKKDGTYAPTAETYITCDVKKTTGGNTTDASSSEYTLKYILNGGSEQTYTSTSVKAKNVTSNLVFVLYDKSSPAVVLDRETIPLVEDGDKGEEGKGYKAVVYRDSFTTENWNTYGTIGRAASWDNTSASRNGCGIGDWFIVVGRATDGTKAYHKMTFVCDNTSGNLHGSCIEHQITEDGISPFSADLDNEMDSVACNSLGNATATTRLYTKVSAYYGTTLITSNCTVKLISNDFGNNATIRLVSSGSDTGSGTVITSSTPMSSAQYIRVQFSSNVSVLQHGNIILEVENANYGTRQLTFTINGVKAGASGDAAVIYKILPIIDVIKRDTEGVLTPTSPITCSVQKVTGSNVSSATSSDGTLRYRVDGDISHYTDGTAWTSGSYSVSVSYTSSNKYITFAFFSLSNTLLDKERVPIVYDGKSGKTPISLYRFFRTQEVVSTYGFKPRSENSGSWGNSSGWGSAFIDVTNRIGMKCTVNDPASAQRRTLVMNHYPSLGENFNSSYMSIYTGACEFVIPSGAVYVVLLHAQRSSQSGRVTVTFSDADIATPTVDSEAWATGTSSSLQGWSKSIPKRESSTGLSLYESLNTITEGGYVDGTAWSTPQPSSTDGKAGSGYATVLTRNNWTVATWTSYGVGISVNFNAEPEDIERCRVGDLFLVVGRATDDGNPYFKNTYRCTSKSSTILSGDCIESQRTDDGSSPYLADIDNEMDSVPCTSSGYTTVAYERTMRIYLWKGSQDLGLSGITYTTPPSNVNVSVNVVNRTVTISVARNKLIASSNVITFTPQSDGFSAVLPIRFTLNGVRAGKSGDDSILYSLVPSVDNIVKKADGTYSASGVSCKCNKIIGSNIYTATDGTFKYSIDGGSEQTYTVDTLVSSSSFTKSVKFIYYKGSTIVDVETIPMVADGKSAPSYNEEYYAWSNALSTLSTQTEPTPNSGWQSSIGATGGYAYLWKKIIPKTYNSSTNSYTSGTAQYFRMSGTNGTSIQIKGTVYGIVASTSALPATGSDGMKYIVQGESDLAEWDSVMQEWGWTSHIINVGDAYTITNSCIYNGQQVQNHLFQLTSEGGARWIDLGQFKGDPGVTWYTHIAWAISINLDSQGRFVSADGFITDKPANDTLHMWMGVLVDTNSGQDPNNAENYTWTYLKGAKGEQGAVGRFYYFGGVWEEIPDDNDHKFPVTDTQIPYFKYTNSSNQETFAVFNKQTNGEYKKSQMTPLSNGKPDTNTSGTPWSLMYNQQKYYIAEAIFANFAHFGSAIISGDFMLSTYGTLYDSSGNATVINASNSVVISGVTYNKNNAYTKFNASSPNANLSGQVNFVPTYCVNLLTGATYQQNAYVSGVIKAKATYTTIGSVSSGTYGSPTNIPLESSPSNVYIVSGYSRLPSPTNYIGLQITLIFSANSVVLCNGDNSADGFITSGYGISNYSIGSNPVSRIGGSQTTTFNNIGAYIGGETLTLLASPSGAFANRPIWVVVSQRGILREYLSLPSLSSYNEMYPDGGMMLNE